MKHTPGGVQMEFSVNWSPQARDLLRAGKIQIDRWKVTDWDSMIADARVDAPVYVHFPLVLGQNRLMNTDWERVETLLRETSTPHVNVHLEPWRTVLGDLPHEEVMDLCIREAQEVVRRFGGEYVVLENIPYRREQAARKFASTVTAEAVTRVIEEAGCRLLLDTGHARITADALGLDVHDYIRALPLARLREVHQVGVITFTQAIYDSARAHAGFEEYYARYESEYQFGILMDHFGMESETDWSLFGWLLEQIQHGIAAAPRLIAFEYGGTGGPFSWRSDPAVLARDVPRLYAMVHGRVTEQR
ncbi:MAG: DUF692 family protein [bacterium]|nr:DUF692 family protein [bacterium]